MMNQPHMPRCRPEHKEAPIVDSDQLAAWSAEIHDFLAQTRAKLEAWSEAAVRESDAWQSHLDRESADADSHSRFSLSEPQSQRTRVANPGDRGSENAGATGTVNREAIDKLQEIKRRLAARLEGPQSSPNP